MTEPAPAPPQPVDPPLQPVPPSPPDVPQPPGPPVVPGSPAPEPPAVQLDERRAQADGGPAPDIDEEGADSVDLAGETAYSTEYEQGASQPRPHGG